MDNYLRLPVADRKLYCEQAGANLGLPPGVIEKDFWVCWTLRELFSLPGLGSSFVFKGGTSLSKGWKLIKRFSEDIDIVIDRMSLGFPGDHSLSRKRCEKLREEARAHVQGPIAKEMKSRIVSARLENELELTNDEQDSDGQALLLKYETTFGGGTDYLRPMVRIEMGARSDTHPSETIDLRTMLAEALPQAVEHSPFEVRALSPKRTFWEKAMLLHEEAFRSADKPRKPRMARHYYDLWCLINAGIARKAADDADLFRDAVEHRKLFFRRTGIDYTTLRPGSLRIVPADDILKDWESDYLAMKDYFYDEHLPAWPEIIETIRQFESAFNALSRASLR